MKKLNIAFIVALAAICLAACDNKETTELRWELQEDSVFAKDIRWIPANGGDVSYSRELNSKGELTEFKEIGSDSLDGNGYCNFNGTEGKIDTGGGNYVIRLSEGSSETYGITGAAK